MKSILYVGDTLMIGAGIYGFVDYKKTNHKKEFVKMYDSKDVIEPVNDIKNVKEIPEKRETEIKEKTVIKKQIPKNDKVGENKITDEEFLITPEEMSEKTTVSLSDIAEKKDKPVKKLNYKLFSRAPLDRKYLEKEFKLEQLKIGEPGKIIKKDSL